MRAFQRLLFIILVSANAFGAEPTFPLLGLWNEESATIKGEADPPDALRRIQEWEFRPDGQGRIYAMAGSEYDTHPPTSEIFWVAEPYKITGPDSFEVILQSPPNLPFRFEVKGDRAFLYTPTAKPGLDLKIVLRRIQKTQFKGVPREQKEPQG